MHSRHNLAILSSAPAGPSPNAHLFPSALCKQNKGNLQNAQWVEENRNGKPNVLIRISRGSSDAARGLNLLSRLVPISHFNGILMRLSLSGRVYGVQVWSLKGPEEGNGFAIYLAIGRQNLSSDGENLGGMAGLVS